MIDPLGGPARAAGAATAGRFARQTDSNLIAALRTDEPEHCDRDRRKANAHGYDRQHVLGA